jgi:hypothetical protein
MSGSTNPENWVERLGELSFHLRNVEDGGGGMGMDEGIKVIGNLLSCPPLPGVRWTDCSSDSRTRTTR